VYADRPEKLDGGGSEDVMRSKHYIGMFLQYNGMEEQSRAEQSRAEQSRA
jgi:hypothetical protein